MTARKVLALGMVLPLCALGEDDGALWRFYGAEIDQEVRALAVDDQDRVYVGGNFTRIGELEAAGVACWDGTHWTALGAGVTGGLVYALRFYEGSLYAGGSFTNAGGQPANRIARWDGSRWSTLGEGVHGPVVLALDEWRGSLVVGGRFTNAGGRVASAVALWRDDAWEPLTPLLLSDKDYPATVRSVAKLDNRLCVGGQFQLPPSTSDRYHYAAWDGAGWVGGVTRIAGRKHIYWVTDLCAQAERVVLLPSGWLCAWDGMTNVARLPWPDYFVMVDPPILGQEKCLAAQSELLFVGGYNLNWAL